MNESPVIVWFRRDLRLADHPALAQAAARGPVIPLFIWSPAEEGAWAPGAASRWWLHQSLAALDASLRRKGSRLILRAGTALEVLEGMIRATGAKAAYWNRLYEPAAMARDAALKAALKENGCDAQSFPSALLFEPWQVKSGAGKPYQVFTPFWRSCLQLPVPEKPLPEPDTLRPPAAWPESAKLDSFRLQPIVDWAGGMRKAWKPGECGARDQLKEFLQSPLATYATGRDVPALRGTSRLSPFLHFGEISPRQIWRAVHSKRNTAPKSMASRKTFLRELGWREFAGHLLFHFPQTPEHPLRREFARLEWASNTKALKAWQRGRTGYPIVDAGMRELWATGWMHNRVRMIVASFLVKDLLLPWQKGAQWFWDTLVDADLASNTLGWQWSAGCGADAAPFFRIFNPVRQGEKFDPAGDYVRRWVPELAGLPAKWVHKPWEAPADVLRSAKITLGKTYPKPIVDHAAARKRALAAFAGIRRKGRT